MKRREIIPLKLGECRTEISHCDVLDRVETLPSGKQVLLPAWCNGGAVRYSADMLRVVLTDDKCSVLITGETGTGKEAFFQCIKEKSERKHSSEINCAGLTNESLVESELFGHLKGAYTGAEMSRDGLVKKCENGILFLDEIGWLPKPVQAKLLRFMETGKFRPVGSDDEQEAKNVRIVAATNQNVEDVMLPDLVFRFDHHIGLPSLRERGVDVLWFLSHPGFLGEQSIYTGVSLRTLIGVLCNPWKGNVRELAKYCQRKVMFRCCETGEPNEYEFVLDDEELAKKNGFGDWVRMARAALAGAEKEESTHAPFADVRECMMVLGVLDDIQNWRGRNQNIITPNQYSAGLVLSIDGLCSSLFGESGDWLTMFVPAWVRGAGISLQGDDTEGGGLSIVDTDSFAGILVELQNVVNAMCPAEPGQAAAYAQPSKEWVKALRGKVDALKLFTTSAQPDVAFEKAMTDAGLDEKGKKICRLSNLGKSAQEIYAAQGSAKPKPKTIAAWLAKWQREFPQLKAYLKKGKAGRKVKATKKKRQGAAAE